MLIFFCSRPYLGIETYGGSVYRLMLVSVQCKCSIRFEDDDSKRFYQLQKLIALEWL